MEALIIIMVVVVLYLVGTRLTKEDNRLRDDELIRLTDLLDDVHIESPYKVEPIVATKRKTKKKTKKAVKKVSPKKKLKVVKKKTKTKRKRK
jgi:hypothetical protein